MSKTSKSHASSKSKRIAKKPKKHLLKELGVNTADCGDSEYFFTEMMVARRLEKKRGPVGNRIAPFHKERQREIEKQNATMALRLYKV